MSISVTVPSASSLCLAIVSNVQNLTISGRAGRKIHNDLTIQEGGGSRLKSILGRGRYRQTVLCQPELRSDCRQQQCGNGRQLRHLAGSHIITAKVVA